MLNATMGRSILAICSSLICMRIFNETLACMVEPNEDEVTG
jgi:hypothetical protein